MRVTAPLREPVLNTCGNSDYGYMYYRMTFDNRLLIGGGRKLFKEQEHDTTDDRVTDPVQRFLEAYLHEHFPEVDAPIDRRWAGIMGFSVDGLPQVGTLPGMPRAGFAVGFTGHGLAFGAGRRSSAHGHTPRRDQRGTAALANKKGRTTICTPFHAFAHKYSAGQVAASTARSSP